MKFLRALAAPFQFERLDTPGTIMMYQGFFEMLADRQPGRFLEVGCGYGSLTRRLIGRGWEGIAVDMERNAIDAAQRFLEPECQRGDLQLVQANLFELNAEDLGGQVDICYAMMVMEHIEDDAAFLQAMGRLVKPGGLVIVGVPGGSDKWNFEDQLVGHLRRYDRDKLEQLFPGEQFVDCIAWSIGVPLANWSFAIGDRLVRRSEVQGRQALSTEEQTQLSWDINIPFKTTFPRFSRWLMHEKFLLAPFCAWQRRHYLGDRGTVMLGAGRVR